jgi:Mn2+/Fe2+ NRAMP family transporter
MATSAIGPGFLTQTSLFTQQVLSSFGFVILITILIDIVVQINIWRIVAVSATRAQDLANKLIPGLGFFLAALIAIGGLVFNIGNIAGCGLGFEVITGLNPKIGAGISCLIALGIFWFREAGKVMDIFVKILGLLMIGLTVYVAIVSQPPVAEAMHRAISPERIDILMIVTIIGGTVGGYISFAGAHRLIDAGIKGKEHIRQVTNASVSGIFITGVMRTILFLAALGAVWHGVRLDPGNPAATVFQSAAGEIGYTFFGIVLWCAAITSVVGASFTSVSFWKTLVPAVAKHEKVVISIFILISTFIFIEIGRPVTLLVFAGALNGIILPLALVVILLIARKSSLLNGYRHPLFLQVIGWIVVAVMSWMAVLAIKEMIL